MVYNYIFRLAFGCRNPTRLLSSETMTNPVIPAPYATPRLARNRSYANSARKGALMAVRNTTDSDFVAHFTKGADAQNNLIEILNMSTIRAHSIQWINREAVCFTECPWSSLLTHVGRYSPFGIGFSKSHVFAAGGGPVYYVRADHWEKQRWDNHIKTFATPFWPSYRVSRPSTSNLLNGQTVDFSHEREWRVPHNFAFSPDQVKFIVLPDYGTMAAFPKIHKDAIGRHKLS